VPLKARHFKDKRHVSEFRVTDHPGQRLVAHFAIAQVLMPVLATAEGGLGVVQVYQAYPVAQAERTQSSDERIKTVRLCLV